MDQLTTGTRGALLEHGTTCGCPFLTVDVASRPGSDLRKLSSGKPLTSVKGHVDLNRGGHET